MILDLLELQKGSKATAVVILDSDCEKLNQPVIINANISDYHLFANKTFHLLLREKLNLIANTNDTAYFIIKNISEIKKEQQNRYLGLVKDRELNGYILPNNTVIIFTIKNKEDLKKISKELYHFCVIGI